jgi:hypothetical protein
MFSMLRQIDTDAQSKQDLQEVTGADGFPLNVIQLSDQAQLLLIGHVIPGGFMTVEDMVWLKSQPAEFHARRLAEKRDAARALLAGNPFAYFYAGETLFVVQEGVDVIDYFPIAISAFGPSAHPRLENLTSLELRAYSNMYQVGKVMNQLNYPAMSRCLTLLSIVEGSVMGNTSFLCNTNKMNGVIRRQSGWIFCIEPRGSLGVGGAILVSKTTVYADPHKVIIPKDSKITSLAGLVFAV